MTSPALSRPLRSHQEALVEIKGCDVDILDVMAEAAEEFRRRIKSRLPSLSYESREAMKGFDGLLTDLLNETIKGARKQAVDEADDMGVAL